MCVCVCRRTFSYATELQSSHFRGKRRAFSASSCFSSDRLASAASVKASDPTVSISCCRSSSTYHTTIAVIVPRIGGTVPQRIITAVSWLEPFKKICPLKWQTLVSTALCSPLLHIGTSVSKPNRDSKKRGTKFHKLNFVERKKLKICSNIKKNSSTIF